MRSFVRICFLCSILLIFGCEQSHKQDSEPPSDEPKTTYGKAVGKAKDLSFESEERSDEVKKQADSLFQDQ